MNTLNRTLVSALTVGALTVTFAGDALADHGKGKGGKRGRGVDFVEVYVDAGPNRALQQMVSEELERHNPRVNVVYGKRFADVIVKVDGYLSEPYRAGGRHGYGQGRYNNLVAMDYDYKIKVRAGGRVIYKDRVRGQVTEPLRGRSGGYTPGGYHYNNYDGYAYGYSKGELAKDAFSILVDVIASNRHRDRGGYYGDHYNVEEALAYEAFDEVARYVAHIKIPKRRRGRGWY